MSVKAAIWYAICAQTAADGKRQFSLNETLNTGGAANGYSTDAAVRRLLCGVAALLLADDPPRKFSWPALNDNLLTDDLRLLVERIAENTTIVNNETATTETKKD